MTAELDAAGPAAPPRQNGELVFAAPWERRLFGVTMALHERGVFAWDEFRALLIDEIARWQATAAAAGAAYAYYERWERALSRLLGERGVIDPAVVRARARELAALPPGHDHDGHDHHDHDHDHHDHDHHDR
jgi:nitrile hydratase accessory protein